MYIDKQFVHRNEEMFCATKKLVHCVMDPLEHKHNWCTRIVALPNLILEIS